MKLAHFSEFKRHFAALLLALAMMSSLIMPALLNLKQSQSALWHGVDWVASLIFTCEYGLRLWNAKDRRVFFRENLTDVAIILLTLPALLFANDIALFLAGVRGILLVVEVGKDLKHFTKAHNLPYVLAVVAMTVLICGCMEYKFEHKAKGSNITSVSDGVWMGEVTMFTVGYGDKYPITVPGKIVASILMFVGSAFTGVFSGIVTSVILKKDEEQLREEAYEMEERFRRLIKEEMASLHEALENKALV